MEKNVNKEKELADKFNEASDKIFKSKVKYEDLETIDFIKLKNALSSIHNIITMKVTQAFIDKLEKDGFVNECQAKSMKEEVNGKPVNANGYDVCYVDDNGDKNILAEVKCNLPVNKNTFGSDQKEGIIKDIDGLLGSEFNTEERAQSNKKRKSSFDTSKYYKFMVFLNYENEEQKSVKKSVDNLIKNLDEKHQNKLKYYIDISTLQKTEVFIVFIEI